MATSIASVPIALIGIHQEIGGPVSEGLKPKYEVVHFMQSMSAAKEDLPHLLQTQSPPNAHANDVGTGDYSRQIRAVVMGRGFSEEQGKELHAMFDSMATLPVLWVVGENSKKPPGLDIPPGDFAEKQSKFFGDILDEWWKRGASEGELFLY
ncbi:hypothetical protein F5Y18DRAFT_411337 [Xylariaceae sp. FL1019]|nr:hypothetical protein F5Y18DRAFT_411337 [Xylariaceae sp. FL1019]